MIQIEITLSPDFNVLAPFKFYQNQLYVGRVHGDLHVRDPELLPSHIMLEVIGQELLIHPQQNVEFYLINSKRASQIRKLKIGDVVTIGKTNFKVLGFEETVVESKKDILNKKLNQLVQENSLRIPVIENLTKLTK